MEKGDITCYARLEDEYELKERLDTRSLPLELAVVALILIEVAIGCFQIFAGRH